MAPLAEPTTAELLRMVLDYDPAQVRTEVKTSQNGTHTSVKIYIPTQIRKKRALRCSPKASR